MASLYFLGKYDVMLAIVIVLSNSICYQFRCCVLIVLVTCFNLTSRWFFYPLTILPVSPMYTCLQKQSILYTPAELSRGL